MGINHLETEQVDVTKLLGVTLDCKLPYPKHIDTRVAKMGRSLSHSSTFLTALLFSRVWSAEQKETDFSNTCMLNAPSCLFELLAYSPNIPCIPYKPFHKRSLHSPQVQNRQWEAHSTR
jgi:hypothetical protein